MYKKEKPISKDNQDIKNDNIFFNLNTKSENDDNIIIEFGEANKQLQNNKIFGNNIIKTTKYNIFTLVPKNLFYQLCRTSNIYFLIVSILSCLSFSPKNPTSMIGTFVFVLVFTMVKDAAVDYGRYQQDNKSNNRIANIFMKKKWSKEPCYMIKPGDIIKLEQGEESPCDILIIKSGNKNGYVYIDTKNLDGESNLKEKCTIEILKSVPMKEKNIENFYGRIHTKKSDADLHHWEGTLDFDSKKNIYCNIKNLLLKGTVLKNTTYVYGIAVFTGHQTKIMKNAHNPSPKTSKIIKTMDKLMYSLFAFTFLICIIFGIMKNKFIGKYYNSYDYIFNSSKKLNNAISRFFINFLIFFIDYYQIIPISLYVVMEIIKIYQGILIYYDFEIYDLSLDKPAICRESGLIEELGQIEFIFSDKTGTLTKNEMEFKKCFINGKIYGAEKQQNECTDTYHSINGDMTAYDLLSGNINLSKKFYTKEDKIKVDKFFKLLCICHEVFPHYHNKKIEYQGASPDDIALVRGAQQLGYEFQKKSFNNLIIKNSITNEIISCDLKILLPFDSDRKRMTTVIKNNNTMKFYILSKGADGIMLQGVDNHPPIIGKYNYIEEKKQAIKMTEKFSNEGLRILVMGYKEVTSEQINFWEKIINSAKLTGNTQKLLEIYDDIEKDLIFLGCSAIQDKLQDGVPESIKTLMKCGIRIWVLTGDKLETSEQIGRQCNLLNDEMNLINLCFNKDNSPEYIDELECTYNKLYALCSNYDLMEFTNQINIKLDDIVEKYEKSLKQKSQNLCKPIAMIIDGNTLFHVLEDIDTSKLFFLMGVISKSVICCRVSPKQKSSVVNLVKSYGEYVTLAIGDGANDVPMIMEASIGIGIQGKEGTQAVRSADYSVGQFRFLEKLLLYYGRNGYTKIAKYISYYFYKNIILVVTELIFAFYNGYSGQIFFPDWYGTMFNAIFTSWPCIFVFAYEKELSTKICQKFPVVYMAGPKNYHFNLKSFWGYIIFALIHSILCFVIPAYGLKTVINKTGSTLNNWKIATVSFSMVIHVVSIKLLIISNFWNIINILFTILSVILYYIIIVCLCLYSIGKIFQPEIIGIFWEIMTNYQCVCMIIFGPFLICLPDIITKQFYYTYFPNPVEYLKKNSKNSGYLRIIGDQRVSTNNLGSLCIDENKKRFTKGYNEIQTKMRLLHKITPKKSSNSTSNIFHNKNQINSKSNINISCSKENDNSMNTLKSKLNILNGKFYENYAFEKLNYKDRDTSKNKQKLDDTENRNNYATNYILRSVYDDDSINNPNEIYTNKDLLKKTKKNLKKKVEFKQNNNINTQIFYPKINKINKEEDVFKAEMKLKI